MKNAKTNRTIANVLSHVFLTILSIIWLLPVVWLIMQSFRATPTGAFPKAIIPETWTISNYTRLFTETDLFNFPRWFMNTLVVAIASCILTTILTLLTAYAFSRLRFKARKPLMNVILILGMFPGFMSMIAVYHILKAIGLAQSLLSLVLVYSGGAAMGYYVAKGFFDTIPKTIDEAAYIDGASKWQTFVHITLPMSKPIITHTLLTAFMGPWTDYIFARVIMGQDTKYYTVAIGLWTMLEKEYIDLYYTQFYAGCVLISIPISILFLMTQKCYVEGVSGAVKG